jgi:hypothetical protein
VPSPLPFPHLRHLSTPLAGLEIAETLAVPRLSLHTPPPTPDSCPPSLVLPCAHCAISVSSQVGSCLILVVLCTEKKPSFWILLIVHGSLLPGTAQSGRHLPWTYRRNQVCEQHRPGTAMEIELVEPGSGCRCCGTDQSSRSSANTCLRKVEPK